MVLKEMGGGQEEPLAQISELLQASKHGGKFVLMEDNVRYRTIQNLTKLAEQQKFKGGGIDEESQVHTDLIEFAGKQITSDYGDRREESRTNDALIPLLGAVGSFAAGRILAGMIANPNVFWGRGNNGDYNASIQILPIAVRLSNEGKLDKSTNLATLQNSALTLSRMDRS